MGLALDMLTPCTEFCEGLACFYEEPWYVRPLHTQFAQGWLISRAVLGHLEAIPGRFGCILGRLGGILGLS